VLSLLAVGKAAKEIGQELFLSQATVRNHIRALLLALGAHSQLEALAKAREAGLLTQ
jgi:DNA-binding NarL/FixJ family response regulator